MTVFWSQKALGGHDGGLTGSRLRVVDEEVAVGREVGMEGEAEQSELATACDVRGWDGEERRLEQRAVLPDPDLAGLLDDEQPPAAVAWVHYRDRRRQAGGPGKLLQVEGDRPSRRSQAEQQESNDGPAAGTNCHCDILHRVRRMRNILLIGSWRLPTFDRGAVISCR